MKAEVSGQSGFTSIETRRFIGDGQGTGDGRGGRGVEVGGIILRCLCSKMGSGIQAIYCFTDCEGQTLPESVPKPQFWKGKESHSRESNRRLPADQPKDADTRAVSAVWLRKATRT